MKGYERIITYFKPYKFKRNIFITVFALILAIITLNNEKLGLITVGLLIFVFYKIIVIRKNKKKLVFDREIDEYIKREENIIFNEGLNKLGINVSDVNFIDPIIISEHLFESKKTSMYIKRGRDGKTRSSNQRTTTFYLSNNQVYVYRKLYSLVGSEKTSSTHEYFYSDIVSVSTFTDGNKNINEIDYQYDVEIFKMTMTDGNSIECRISDIQALESQIKALRQVVRDQKKAA
ncbi:hypothetical protein RJG79_03345 [Mycoplasmatota bacterium WC44]